ncbi:hypothetical protein AWB65_01638 [Caballeronia humi]|uniref:Peptidase S41 n=1 Tax=Caballeronia humi TaxID=326474 RepID=A0A158G7M1_9BURK|nr:hypothetical protein AWB65_01638 [Caballeronia humi]
MLATALLAGGCSQPVDDNGEHRPADARAASGTDAALRLYTDALSVITQRAAFATADTRQVVARMLTDYLGAEDPYSGFMTRDEYAKYRALSKGSYGGVGMDLERRHSGETICYPYARGPAELAGVRAGERLVSIDGTLVAGKPLPVLAALATGAQGSPVLLQIADASGATRRVSVTRSRVDAPALTLDTVGSLQVIRIARFAPSTRSEVEAALARWDAKHPVVFDLRGCGGGDFYAAIDTAMLFLDKGLPIVTVSGRDGARLYSSTLDRTPRPHTPYLWQDEATASAAEVFIAALTGNERGVSIGTQSAGKGSRQDIFELADGSALILTTGYLTAPRGLAFNGRGLAPMKALAAGAGTAAYASATPSTE